MNKELSACCQAPKGQSSACDSDLGHGGAICACGDGVTVNEICSKCKKPFIPNYICRPCGIQRGTGKPKGRSEDVAKRGWCGWCNKVTEVVPPIFYNIK